MMAFSHLLRLFQGNTAIFRVLAINHSKCAS